MPVTQTVDEEVSVRINTRGGLSARPVQNEAVNTLTGAVKVDRGAEDDTHNGNRKARVFKESTEKLLQQLEKEEQDERAPAPHEEGDVDEDEAAGEDVDEVGASDGDAGDEAGESGGESQDGDGDEEAAEGDGAEEGEGEGDEKVPETVDLLQATNERLQARNRELLDELETARKTPKAQRSDRETALLAAESAYVDEGAVPALRKFLSIITGAAADSKEVNDELHGVFADLTALELGVPLDENQRTLRDNARTRLLLSRDKREKVEAGKKPDADNDADAVQYENATKYVDNLLSTKGQSGTSIADEYPMLMSLAEDFDGYKPAEVLARAIRQEIMTGTLDPKTNDLDIIRIVAPKIENHYAGVAKRIEAARAKKNKKPDTTPSAKPKAAVEASKEQRQSHGARTLTNAAASRAPAKLPKAKVVKGKTGEKTRKDFSNDATWRDYLLSKHFKS